jgi:hypothetical protein
MKRSPTMIADRVLSALGRPGPQGVRPVTPPLDHSLTRWPESVLTADERATFRRFDFRHREPLALS